MCWRHRMNIFRPMLRMQVRNVLHAARCKYRTFLHTCSTGRSSRGTSVPHLHSFASVFLPAMCHVRQAYTVSDNIYLHLSSRSFSYAWSIQWEWTSVMKLLWITYRRNAIKRWNELLTGIFLLRTDDHKVVEIIFINSSNSTWKHNHTSRRSSRVQKSSYYFKRWNLQFLLICTKRFGCLRLLCLIAEKN